MNYLAHARLSFGQPEITVGNMISDFVKGRKRFDYAREIQKGIMLHRNIDTFTDKHEATKEAKQFFKPATGLYAGAFIDVAYDHFLAKDPTEFENDQALLDFSLEVYRVLDNYQQTLPQLFSRVFHYMKTDNWLYNYRMPWSIEKSFGGLMHRAKYLEYNPVVFECFEKNYEALRKCYQSFFPAVKTFAHHQLMVINDVH